MSSNDALCFAIIVGDKITSSKSPQVKPEGGSGKKSFMFPIALVLSSEFVSLKIQMTNQIQI